MKIVKKYSNKLTAIVLAIMLIVSVFSGTFNLLSFAAPTFEKVLNSPSISLPNGVNLTGLNNMSRDSYAYAFWCDDFSEFAGTYPSKHSILSNGDFNGDAQYVWDKNAQVGQFASFADGQVSYNLSGSIHMDIYYDFRSEVDLDYIVIGNHATPELVTGQYDVYIADSIDNLYLEDNLYASVDNRGAYESGSTNRINVICFDKGNDKAVNKGRVVGIRIKNPVATTDASKNPVLVVNETQNNIYPRVTEFAVYGDYIDESFNPEATNGYTDFKNIDISTIKDNYGESLLKNAPATVYYGSNKMEGMAATFQNIANKCANLETGYQDISVDGEDVLYVGYKINGDKDLMRVDGFAHKGMLDDRLEYLTSYYEVYVAEDYSDLYLPENKAYTYHAVTSGDEKEKGYDFISSGQFVEFKTPKYGNFIGFKFIKHEYTAMVYKNPRVSFLYAWGKEAVREVYETNAIKAMPADTYFVNEKGKNVNISESNLTVKEFFNLTDDNKSTSAVINTTDNGRETATLLFNLCSDVDIAGLELHTEISSKYNFTNFEVYAAKSLADINKESSIVWSGYMGSASGEVSKVKRLNKSKNARYVKFVFSGTGEYIKINDLSVIGPSTQANVQRNLTNILAKDNITVYKNEIGSDSWVVQSNLPETRIGHMIDMNSDSFCPLLSGTVGKHKYDIIVDLEDLRTINEINLDFLRHFENYWPEKVNVYVEETSAKIYSNNTEPTYVITKADINEKGIHAKLMKPRLARYIRIEFVEFTKNHHYIDDEGKQMIASMLAELDIAGSNVKGVQPSMESDLLVSFPFPEYNMQVDIMRLDTNDIFARLADVKVTKVKATNNQMLSINSAPYMKVIDKSVYKIEFIDINGNAIKDIDERYVMVYFDSIPGSTTVVANASDKHEILQYETTEVGNQVGATIDWSKTADNVVAHCEYISSDDPYWSTIGDPEPTDEEEDNGPQPEHPEEWYDSIRTTDGRFVVTPISATPFKDGTEFKATDISESASDEEYYSVLEYAFGKKVAVYYDMELTYNDEPIEIDGTVNVSLTIPDFIKDNFTDLEIVYVDESGQFPFLYCETLDNTFNFEAYAMGKFVIIGTALDGSSSFSDGSF